MQLGFFPVVTGSLASGLRAARGTRADASTAPERPLELWSFEASPFCRIVRERLCELELPYVLHNVGRGSAARADFARRSGKMQVPYLNDPNTGESLFESSDIVAYLDRVYSKGD
jgi:glutaredoxin